MTNDMEPSMSKHHQWVQEMAIDDDFVDQSSEETSLRSVLMYQYHTPYRILIMLSIYVACLHVSTDVVFEMVQPSKKGEESINFKLDCVHLCDFIYLVDMIFRVVYKLTPWSNQKLYKDDSMAEALVIDSISLIPMEVMHGLVNNDVKMYAIYRLRVLLRVFRLVVLSENIKTDHRTQNINMVMFQIMSTKLAITYCIALIHYYMYCTDEVKRDGECGKRDFMVLLTLFYSAVKITLSTGADQEIFEVETMNNVSILANVLVEVYSFYIISKLACIKIESMKAHFIFMHNYANIKKTYNFWKNNYRSSWNSIDVEIKYTLRDYYSNFLKKRNGILWRESLFKNLPKGLKTSILVDVAYNALSHSHVFRHEEVHVMRYLAGLAKFEFAIPGEVIIKRGEVSAKMIYVSHGVVQILSAEDRETPALHLSGGTCLGEMMLFFPYQSACTVISQTYCEFVIWYTKDFSLIASHYPERYRFHQNQMLKRIERAKLIRGAVKKFLDKKQNNLTKNDMLIMGWIERFKKYIWDAENINEEQMTKKNRLFYYIDNLVFYVEHLDKFVVSDEIELITDSVFIKTTFHFVLQPNSSILFVLDLIILGSVVLFLVIYPYYVAFGGDTYDSGVVTIAIMVTFAFAMDVYIQMFTAIKTSGAIFRTPREIFIYRIQEPEFIMDCIAAMPIEVIFLICGGLISPKIYLMFQSNRLLKYYKIVRFFKKIDVYMSKSLTTTFRLLQSCVHGIFFVYYCTFIMFIINCSNEKCTPRFEKFFADVNATTKFQKLSVTFSMSICLAVSVTFGPLPFTPRTLEYLAYSAISIGFYVYHISFFSTAIAYNALCHIEELNEQESLSSTISALQNFDVGKDHHTKIDSYLKQVWFIRDVTFSDTSHLSEELKICYKNIHFLRFFKRTLIFQDIPSHMLSTLCLYIRRLTLPANQVIYYSGEISSEFCFIEDGFCNLTSRKSRKTAKKFEIIGLLEMLQRGPLAHTVVTETDCIILEVTKDNFERFLCKYPELKQMFDDALDDPMFQNESSSSSSSSDLHRGDEEVEVRHEVGRRRDYMIRNLLITDAPEEIIGSRKWSIAANGNLIFYWEIFRCFCAFLNATVGMLYYTSDKYRYMQFSFLYMCDVISVIDIIIRFFVSYYDAKGIEIYSPSKTSWHYFTHAFILDLLGTVPLDLFLKYEVLFTRVNRCIFMYRIHGIIDLVTNRIKKIRYLYYTATLLELLCVFYFMAFFINYLRCDFGDRNGVYIPATDLFAENVRCDENSWLALSNMRRPLDPAHTTWESVLLVISLFCCVGYRKFKLGDWFERTMMSLWTLCGFFVEVNLISKAVSHILFMNADLTIYQQAMNDLVMFLSYCKIDKNLKEEVINYFEYIWENRTGKNLKDLMKRMPTALREDTLYDIYGASMRDYSIFNLAEKSMIKELLLLAMQGTFLKTGILYRVNDVHGTIFYLLKGNVEVVGPDKNRLLTLPPGSLFGCLDDVTMSRHTLMMVAKGHVETLLFPSTSFHRLLRKYPKFLRVYKRMTLFNIDYIVGDRPAIDDTLVSNYVQVRAIRFAKVFHPNKVMNILEVILYIYAFCIGGPMEIMLHILKPTIRFLIVPYLHDLLWILRIYYKFHVAYEDEYGMLVFDKKKIAKRYLKSRTGFYLDLITNIPLDVGLVNSNYFLYVRICRINRFLRAVHLFLHMRKTINKLNINVFAMRFLYTIMYIYFYLQVTGTLVYISATKWAVNDVNFAESILIWIPYVDTVVYILSGICNPHTHINNADITIILTYLIISRLCLLVFIYSSFTSTLQIVTKTSTKYQSNYLRLENFMNFTGTSLPIVEMVQIYLDLLLKVKNGSQFPFLLEEAPYYLREAVLNSMFGFHLRNHPIFKNCHVDFVRQLSATMRTRTFFENNQITYKGDTDGRMYFIHEGRISALTEDTLYKEVCAEVLMQGDCFGLNQIVFEHEGHAYTYKATKLTIVVFITKEDFDRLLNFFPAARKHIYQEVNRASMEGLEQ